jgi:hypothetical protein
VLLEAWPCCRVVVCSDEDGVSKDRGTTAVNYQTAGRRERRKVGNWWCYSIRRCEGGVWGGLWLEHCLCLCPLFLLFARAGSWSWSWSWSRRALSRLLLLASEVAGVFPQCARPPGQPLSPAATSFISYDPSDEGPARANNRWWCRCQCQCQSSRGNLRSVVYVNR